MDKYRTPETEAPDRDPRTGAPDAGVAPFPGGGEDDPDSPLTPGAKRGEGMTEEQADPSLSIEDVNREPHDGGMIGEGGH